MVRDIRNILIAYTFERYETRGFGSKTKRINKVEEDSVVSEDVLGNSLTYLFESALSSHCPSSRSSSPRRNFCFA